MRKNIPPIREAVFEAFIEMPQRNPNLPRVRLPIVFTKTNRVWAEFFANLASQSATGAEAEIAEDLFAGISPLPQAAGPSEQDLFGALASAPAGSSEISSLARHFLFMGA